ncbi:Bug family tripartite tricarboxylate transporter substrate binding protein [Protaetiibacter larvae]|nr:tripartite tricarboxylate transporter substrate-binding protein [Protaetiibacter larvae]
MPATRTLRNRSIRRSLIAGLAAVSMGAGLAACAPSGGGEEAPFPSKPFTIVVPAAPGGGYDQMGRAVQQALTKSGLVTSNITVFNNPGAGGVLGLNEFSQDAQGDPFQLLSMGVVLLGAEKTSDLDVRVENDTTPIARLGSSYLTIVAKADSDIQSLGDLADKLKADPGSVSIAGSVTGSLEQILMGLFAESIGLDPKAIKYVAYENASEQTTAVLSGDADVSVTGLSETQAQIDDGSMRALVVTSPERIDGVDAPTFEEEGFSADLVTANWRGVVAGPGISDEDRDKLVDLITQMQATPEWKQLLTQYNWSDTFLAGDEFSDFVTSESKRIGDALTALGVTEG